MNTLTLYSKAKYMERPVEKSLHALCDEISYWLKKQKGYDYEQTFFVKVSLVSTEGGKDFLQTAITLDVVDRYTNELCKFHLDLHELEYLKSSFDYEDYADELLEHYETLKKFLSL